jgi:thioredoxin reductase
MTSPMDLPLYGMVKLYDTSKSELLELWNDVLTKNEISISERSKVERVEQVDNAFVVHTSNGEEFKTKRILLAIGRRGTPRKLNVPGEESEKVAYRLLEPELIKGEDILVVGGGDSAIESALLLADDNRVTLSYRKDKFSRLKPKNRQNILEAISTGTIIIKYNTTVATIGRSEVVLLNSETGEEESLTNDRVYIFAGGILPTSFLESMGIFITKKFGEAILSHKKR